MAEPVSVIGFTADVISDKDSAARFAQPSHAGTFAYFEAGAVDDNGVAHDDGLPAGLTLLSATGSRATYQIQPANAKNALQLSAGQTGTLTFTTPAVLHHAVCDRLFRRWLQYNGGNGRGRFQPGWRARPRGD